MGVLLDKMGGEIKGEILTEMGAGLGNQMNIYAAALRLALEKNVQLYLDLSWFKTWPKYVVPRNFGLDKFNISAKIATKKQVKKYILRTKFRYLNSIIRRLKLGKRRVYDENKDFKNVKEFLDLPTNCYIRGYFNKRYYEKIYPRLKKEFMLKKEFKSGIKPLLKKIKNQSSVSICVRRGDLVTNPNWYVLPEKYYKKAVDVIKKRVKNTKFYIFSDDISWCKNNFDWIEDKSFVEGYSSAQGLELMKNCKHNINANSAFSWWASYLNDNPSKIVIAPNLMSHCPSKQQIEKNEKIDYNIPKGWLQI